MCHQFLNGGQTAGIPPQVLSMQTTKSTRQTVDITDIHQSMMGTGLIQDIALIQWVKTASQGDTMTTIVKKADPDHQ